MNTIYIIGLGFEIIGALLSGVVTFAILHMYAKYNNEINYEIDSEE